VLFSTQKGILRSLMLLTIPAAIEYLLQSTLSYADFIMVGRLGKNASASIGLTQEVSFLLKGVLMAAGIGIVSCISIAIGKKQPDKAKKISVQAFFMAAVCGAVLTVAGLGLSPLLPGWFGAEQVIRDEATSYFAIIWLPAVFIALNMLLSSVLRGAGDMKTPMMINITASLSNIILNFVLIYQSRVIHVFGVELRVWGAGLGLKGSAIGTAAASVIGGALMIAGVLKNPVVSPIGEKFKADLHIIKECVKVAVPVFLCRLTTSFGRVLFTAFITGLGTVALAAHTIAFTAESVFYIMAVGMMASVTTLAGNYKGEGSMEKLNQLVKVSSGLVAGVMLVVGVLMFSFSRPIVSLFTTDTAVIGIASVLFCIVAVNEPIFGVSLIMEGIFNGVGDTKSPFIVGAASLWFVRVLGTWTAITVFHTGIYGAWIFMITENAVRGTVLIIRYRMVRHRLITDH
jgi:putative MATE family efflux protein